MSMRYILLCAVLLATLSAGAKNVPYTCLLDSAFNSLVGAKNAEVRRVAYTGDDNVKAGGFVWQRGSGKGWTKGLRVMVPSLSQSDAEQYRHLFERVAKKNFTIKYSPNSAATLDEATGTIYIYAYEPEKDGKLYFMRAVSDNEISVPGKWTDCDSIDATRHNPLKDASPEELAILGLSRLWSSVKRNFVFMERVKFDWDSLYVANIAPVREAAAGGDFNYVARLLQRMAAHLCDGHTFVYGYEQSRMPLTTVKIDNKVYVDKVLSDSLSRLGLVRGMEVKSINGMDPIAFGQDYLAPMVSSSTPQWTEYSTFFGQNLFAAQSGDTLDIEFSNGGAPLSLRYVAGTIYADRVAEPETLVFKNLENNIGYLRIHNFMDSDIRSKFDSIYPHILRTDALVIDIRGNSGGNSGNGDYILKHLTDGPIPLASWSSPGYVPALASWGEIQPVYKESGHTMLPFSDRCLYLNPIMLLVDGGTFSAAEDFCALFRGMKRGSIIGSATGGSTGNGVRETLIVGSAYANICSKHDVGPDGTDFVGVGIIPDVEVHEDYQSYFVDDTDAAVTVAMRRIADALAKLK